MSNRGGPVPESINQLREQLQQFRSTHPRRTKLPESLRQSAVEKARQHGIYVVGVPPQRRRSVVGDSGVAPPAFVELVRSAGVDADEYVVEFDSGASLRMRLRWRETTPEWSSLLRAWREVAG